MKVLKDQNKNMINSEEINNKTIVDNDDVREKIKKIIKKRIIIFVIYQEI